MRAENQRLPTRRRPKKPWHPKRVFIDFTYFERDGFRDSVIHAYFTKDDSDYIAFVEEGPLKKDRDEWKLAAETWKKAFNDLVRALEKRGKRSSKTIR